MLVGGDVIDGEHLDRDVSQVKVAKRPSTRLPSGVGSGALEGAYLMGTGCWQSQQPSHTRERGGGSLLARSQASSGGLAS